MPRPIPLILAFAGVLAFSGPQVSCAAPPEEPRSESAAEEALRDLQAELERARAAYEKAKAAVARAEEDLLRARLREIEGAIAVEDAALEEAVSASDAAEAAAVRVRLRALYRDLVVVAERLGGRAPFAAPVPGVQAAPRRTPIRDPADAFPPLVLRSGNRPGPAAEAALDWLARHQAPVGSWDADGFASTCTGERCAGSGGPLYDPGVTGLAALAFLGAGETHRSEPRGAVVRNAMKYLKGIQDAEGCFGPRTSQHFVYNHALATLAMVEAYALTQSPLFRGSAQSGLDFIHRAQNPYLAWRYGVRPGDNDTSITGWMVAALAAGRGAGLEVEEAAFQGAVAWLDKVTEPEYGRAGYTARGNGPARPQEMLDLFPTSRSESLTAEAVLARLLCGQGRDHPMVVKGTELLGRTLPKWDRAAGGIDFYYWYFGTEAMRRAGGPHEKRWNAALGEALLPAQRGEADGCARGSLDPVDPWGADGGRVYATALAALMYEALER